MERLHVPALLRCDIGTQKSNLLFLLLAAVFLTSLLLSSTGSAATLRSFQSPISPISPVSPTSPVISPPEPATVPPATPTPQPSVPAAPPPIASSPLLWIVIGLVVVGTFTVGLVLFQKRRE
ncbi:MAG: hypothetical protein ACETWR_06270 [Anaerolineae bacterium]